MKIFIVFLPLLLSFSDGRKVLDDTTSVASSTTSLRTNAAPPTALVGVNVTWTFTTGINITNVVMVVKRLGAGEWAAVGLGQHVAMDETHVFMCKRLANDTILINRYANSGYPDAHQPPAPAGTEHGGLFTPLPSQFINGVVICQFTLSNFTSQTFKQPEVLNPLSQSGSYHPIFAVGLLDADNSPQQHNAISREARPNTVQLNQNVNTPSFDSYQRTSEVPFKSIASSQA